MRRSSGGGGGGRKRVKTPNLMYKTTDVFAKGVLAGGKAGREAYYAPYSNFK